MLFGASLHVASLFGVLVKFSNFTMKIYVIWGLSFLGPPGKARVGFAPLSKGKGIDIIF